MGNLAQRAALDAQFGGGFVEGEEAGHNQPNSRAINCSAPQAHENSACESASAVPGSPPTPTPDP